MKLAMILPFVIYLIGMICIGAYSSKNSKSIEGFYLAGRGLGSWVTAFSYGFSGMSAFVLVSYVGLVYNMGPSSFYMLIGFNFGYLFSYLVIAKRVRNYSGLLNAVTYTDYFVKRIRTYPNAIRWILGISTTFFMAGYVASQLVAVGKTAAKIFGISPSTAIVTCAIVVLIYCMSGGFSAVSLTDLIQGILITIGMLAAAFYLVHLLGGLGSVTESNLALNPNFAYANFGGKSGIALLGSILGYIMFSLSLIGRPHDTIRFFAIKSVKQIRKSLFVVMTCLTITYWAAFCIGMGGHVLYPDIADPELLFANLLSTTFPPIFSGIVLVVFMGLMMSTIDSQMLSASSTLVGDLYAKTGSSKSEKKIVSLTKWGILLVGLLATVMAICSPGNMLWVMNFTGSGMVGLYAPLLILTLYWKKLTGPGAIAGMLLGGISGPIFASSFLYKINMGIPVILAFSIGMLGCVIGSLLTKQPYEKEIAKEIELCRQNFDVKAETVQA